MEATMEMPVVEQDKHMSDRRIAQLVKMIEESDAVVVGGASGMSAAGGDSWYDVDPMYLKYYGYFYEKLGDRAGGIFPLLYYPFKEEGRRMLAMARIMHMVDDAEVP